MTWYRKYRPKKIEELDLKTVRELLRTALESGGLAHAYLFVGPRGAGKTSAARILAKAVNCEKNIKLKEGTGLKEPCGKCEMCKSIEAGSAVDVMEIDAASHRGIDAIRELREKIGLAPVTAKIKTYIIDEVHMLTTEAFNALLKTLEEPPEHAAFILCTTEEHKVPETIKSRCVRVGFIKATEEEIKRSLEKVVIGEGIKIEAEALDVISKSVDGSFREAHKLLEQLGQIKGEIKCADVEKLLGSAGADVDGLVSLLLQGQTKEALKEIGRLDRLGVNFSQLGLSMVEVLRGELKAAYGIGKSKFSMETGRVRVVLRATAAACEEMKTTMMPSLPLELLAVEMGEVNGNGKSKIKVEHEEAVVESAKKVEKKVIAEKPEHASEEKEIEMEVGEVNVSIDEIENSWEEVLRNLRPKNHSVAGLLRSARPKAVKGKYLVLEVFYKFHKEQLEQEVKRKILEQTLAETIGPMLVRCELGQKAQEASKKMPEHDNVVVVEESEDEALLKAASEAFGV